MLTGEKFMDLVAANDGFEVTLGFRNDVDHFIGGSGSKVWYFVKKGSSEDYYIGIFADGTWSDRHFVRKRKVLTTEDAPAGKTIELILSELSIGQQKIEESRYKPSKISLYDHPCSHYSFSWGERAYDISDEYGITVEYSNIKDEPAGFRLRNLVTGRGVTAPGE